MVVTQVLLSVRLLKEVLISLAMQKIVKSKKKNNPDGYTLQALRACKTYGYLQVNVYYIKENFSGIALECLEEIYRLMLEGHYDSSDIQTDYFDISWYNRICIGASKSYKLI